MNIFCCDPTKRLYNNHYQIVLSNIRAMVTAQYEALETKPAIFNRMLYISLTGNPMNSLTGSHKKFKKMTSLHTCMNE